LYGAYALGRSPFHARDVFLLAMFLLAMCMAHLVAFDYRVLT